LTKVAATVSDTTGVTVGAHVNLPLLNGVDLLGQVQSNGNYSLTASLPSVTFLGFALTNLSGTFSNSGVSATGHVSLPLLGPVDLSGPLKSDGSFALTVTVPSVTIAGITLTNMTATLSPSGLNASAHTVIPVVGPVDVSGSIQASGDYTLTAKASNINVLFVTLTKLSVTLS